VCGKHGPGHPPSPSRIEKGMEGRICCGGIGNPAVRWICNPAAASIAPRDALAFAAKSGVIWARCTRWYCLPVHSHRHRACPLYTRGLLISLFHIKSPGRS